MAKLSNCQNDPSLTVVASRSGDPTLRVGERWVHSQYDPKKEAQREVDEFLRDGTPAMAVILGGGLGYVAEELATRRPNLKIVVFEPDEGIWKAAVNRWRPAPNVIPIIGRGEPFGRVTSAMDDVSATSYRFLTRLADLDPAFFGAVVTLIGRVAEMLQEGLRATALFGMLWWENAVRNFREIALLPDVGRWRGACEAEPVFIFAAGPSLGDHIDSFRRGEGGLRFVVDTAYETLVSNGIRVDAVFSVDAQEKTLDHFAKHGPDRLVASVVAPTALLRLAERKIITSLAGPLYDWFDTAVGRRIERLKSGGSVTTIAFDLARIAGGNPIVLVGADFAFRDGKRYADQTCYRREEIATSGRFQSVEECSYHAGHGFRITERDQSTDTNLVQYARWMEWEIEETSADVYRLSDFGLLQRTPVLKPAEFSAILGRAPRIPEWPRSESDGSAVRRVMEAMVIERRSLSEALRRGPRGIAELSGFFDPIIRPSAVVSRVEKLDDEAMAELTKKLHRAASVLDEVLGEAR